MDEKQEVEFSPYSVDFSQPFIDEYENFPDPDKIKIDDFTMHLLEYGFAGLPGRNKSSDNVPTDDPEFVSKVRYAQKHKLWHYHIGIPEYDEARQHGDWTSEYVLHYTLNGSDVVIVDMTDHPPMKLPKEHRLK